MDDWCGTCGTLKVWVSGQLTYYNQYFTVTEPAEICITCLITISENYYCSENFQYHFTVYFHCRPFHILEWLQCQHLRRDRSRSRTERLQRSKIHGGPFHTTADSGGCRNRRSVTSLGRNFKFHVRVVKVPWRRVSQKNDETESELVHHKEGRVY